MSEFGVHSEVGKLRKVIVHRPGLEMRRLTPSNCQELLFDDVIWSRKARQDHDAFVDLMREEFGVQVMRVHELLKNEDQHAGAAQHAPERQNARSLCRFCFPFSNQSQFGFIHACVLFGVVAIQPEKQAGKQNSRESHDRHGDSPAEPA